MNLNFSGRGFSSIPPVTRHLLIINFIIWLAEVVKASFGYHMVNLLGLHYWGSEDFNPVQLVSYMFLHSPDNPLHVIFNMFTLWMFGRLLENVWGSRRFLLFYMVCGVGAAVVQELIWMFTWEHDLIMALAKQNGLPFDTMRELWVSQGDSVLVQQSVKVFQGAMLTVGASGAVFGLLLGFAMVFPDMPLYLLFIPVPIKAKYMVLGYAVLEFFLGVSAREGDLVAHFAHLGGMLFGLVMLLIWRQQGKLRGDSFY